MARGHIYLQIKCVLHTTPGSAKIGMLLNSKLDFISVWCSHQNLEETVKCLKSLYRLLQVCSPPLKLCFPQFIS